MTRSGLAALTWAIVSGGAAAQSPTTLGEIVVKGQALRTEAPAFSTTSFTSDVIAERRVTEVEELFREVPGMNVRDYGLGGVANQVVIRGFGNGSHGGDLGFVVDGIPLNEANSHADGYADINVLVPLEVGGLTVYRGPVSALYGNFNRGGLIAFETRKGGEYAEADVSAASHGTLDAQGAVGLGLGSAGRLNAAAQVYRTEGFRPQSEASRATLAGRYALVLSPRLDVALSTRLHASEADSAAYLTPAQFAADPYGIDPRAQNDGSEKAFATLRADVNYTIAPELRLLTFAYTTRQDFTRWFSRGPVAPTALWRQREETYDRAVYGLGANLNGGTAVAGLPLNFVVGVEGFEETTEFQFFEAELNRVRVNAAQSDRESRIESLSAFGEVDLEVTDRLDLSLGFRADRFSGDCRRLGPETGTDPCDSFDAVSKVTPKLGAQFELTPALRLRASYAEGFALPEAFAKYAPGARSLEPTTFSQTEVGVVLTPVDALELDLVAYRSESSDEIRTVRPGEFENVGATLRTGIEASATWTPTDAFEFTAVYGYADSEIEENGNPALLGNRVAGVPDHTGTLAARWKPTAAIRFDAVYRYVGEYALDAANTQTSKRYELLDVGVSYAVDARTPFRLYADVDNVTDEVYASSASLTTIAPGAPRTFRAGVQVGF
jgi:outer membrane receptor protein involved in Fe transport